MSFADECLGHQKDIRWQRSISNTAKGDTSAQYCDKALASGWYRFTSKAGPDMPTACPPARSCGKTILCIVYGCKKYCKMTLHFGMQKILCYLCLSVNR